MLPTQQPLDAAHLAKSACLLPYGNKPWHTRPLTGIALPLSLVIASPELHKPYDLGSTLTTIVWLTQQTAKGCRQNLSSTVQNPAAKSSIDSCRRCLMQQASTMISEYALSRSCTTVPSASFCHLAVCAFPPNLPAPHLSSPETATALLACFFSPQLQR